MKIWPAALPQFVRRNGFEIEAVIPKVSFEPDEGPAIERRKGTVDMEEMPCAVFLKKAPIDQVALFRAFIAEDLEGGALPFLFPHPDTREQCVGKIEGDRPYKLRPISNVEWEAAFMLRVYGE